jgi:hypothetical protein
VRAAILRCDANCISLEVISPSFNKNQEEPGGFERQHAICISTRIYH